MAGSDWVKVEIIATKGSCPRDRGAVLWVSRDKIVGSIGGGNMENDAIIFARSMSNSSPQQSKRYTLGPQSGQCCGGVVDVQFSHEDFLVPPRPMLAIFGAGHVGSSLARLARAIDMDVEIYDTRTHVELPNPQAYHVIALPEIAIDALADHAAIVIMTHDHGLDFLLSEHALRADRFAFVGMIGSKSKAVKFKNQHGALAQKLVSPIAKSSTDKRPEAIALAILSEIWPLISPSK